MIGIMTQSRTHAKTTPHEVHCSWNIETHFALRLAVLNNKCSSYSTEIMIISEYR